MNIRVVIFYKNEVTHVIEKEKLSRKDYELVNNYLMEANEYNVQIYWTEK